MEQACIIRGASSLRLVKKNTTKQKQNKQTNENVKTLGPILSQLNVDVTWSVITDA